MRRAGLLLYDRGRGLVVPAGAHGLRTELLEEMYGTLDETPIAQRALAEDRVVEVSSGVDREIPARYAHFPGVTTLTCTPVSAAGRWLGVIFADRGGASFELRDEERHTMWSLGKMAALAASARSATDREARARSLAARIDLAREIHERVIQRLCGVALVAGSTQRLGGASLERCRGELAAVLEDLRSAISRPLAPPLPAAGGPPLREELARLATLDRDPPLETSWLLDGDLPPELEPLARSVLAEALRNVDKHARPARVAIVASDDGDAFTLEVRNDGIVPDDDGGEPRGSGLGLRLAAFEALEHGGLVEYGREGDEWHVRLVVPLS